MADTFQRRDPLPLCGAACWMRYFPNGFWYEWKKLVVLAVPIMFTSLVEYLIAPVSLFFCGKLGKSELAAAGLAISLFHTAGVSFIMGLLTASETLFAQTYGGKNKFRLGIQVQRSFVILTLCCLPCWAVHVVIEPILVASGQPPLIAKYTGEYIFGMMPGLFNKVLPPLVAGILGNLVNAGGHYFFIYHTNVGIVGSAISQSLGYLCQAGCMLLYILTSKIYRNTWDGLHIEMWHDWGIWFRLAIPGTVMCGLEWWICEAGSLTAGFRGEQALAVQTILNNIESLIFCTFPMGFGIAVCIRVGQFLGSNETVGPKSTAFVGITTLVVVAIVNALILIFGRYHIPRLFTDDPGIIEASAQGMPSIIAYQFFDCIIGVCSGVIRGVGMQRFGAIVCCVCMYMVGGPLALCLLLLTDLLVPGFWWGLSIGMALESVIYIIQCCRIDWVKMCEDVRHFCRTWTLRCKKNGNQICRQKNIRYDSLQS
ncbi:unnamed protein product [Mesocestoides corti]|uniref:Multidrug and toxin extrusion protein n=1 Tax=Mesocestoides corti TaxID=53468 RepID=A0A0R3UI97_MESCO|nr:unnamed protein product [Mesocestoides corti]